MFRLLLKSLRRRRKGGRRVQPRRSTARAAVEILERRWLLSHLDGTWSGLTGQGLPIGARIENDAVTFVSAEVSHCGVQNAEVEHEPMPPLAISGSHVEITRSEMISGFQIDFTIEGDFDSDSHATGTARGTVMPAVCPPFETTWELTKQFQPSPSAEIIDNGDPGFTATGSWTSFAGQGFQNDVHFSAAGNGSDLAR